MPYIDSNITKSIFYSALVGEFLRIARSSLLCKDFTEKVMELLNKMKAQHYPKPFKDMKACLPILEKKFDEILSELHI